MGNGSGWGEDPCAPGLPHGVLYSVQAADTGAEPSAAPLAEHYTASLLTDTTACGQAELIKTRPQA